MLGLRERLELNNIWVTSALTPHTSAIDSFTLKRSLKLLRWGTIAGAYWGVQGTGPNENVSKLETDGPIDGQTDKITKAANKDRQKQTRKSKRAIKKGEGGGSLFQKQWLSCRWKAMPELLQYPCLWQNSGRIGAYCITWGEKKAKG